MKKLEATILKEDKKGIFSANAVTCRLTSRQITFYDSLLWIFHKQIAKFRVSGNTKLRMIKGLVREKSKLSLAQILCIEGAGQRPYFVGGANVFIIMGAFNEFQLRNMGGSEKFADKQLHFYNSVRMEGCKSWSTFHQSVKVYREDPLESSMNSTKAFSLNEWAKRFRICFVGEEGLDEGGIFREWISLLSRHLFDPEYQLFKGLHDGSQALVHPNPDRPPHLSLKHFKFAGRIVGKCMFESSHSVIATILIKAAFTRSFLAQVLGLPVTYEVI